MSSYGELSADLLATMLHLQLGHRSAEEALLLKAADLWSDFGADSVRELEKVVAHHLFVAQCYEAATLSTNRLNFGLEVVSTSTLLTVPPISLDFVFLWWTLNCKSSKSELSEQHSSFLPVIAYRNSSCFWGVDVGRRELCVFLIGTDGEVQWTVLALLEDENAVAQYVGAMIQYRKPRYTTAEYPSAKDYDQVSPGEYARVWLNRGDSSAEIAVQHAVALGVDPAETFRNIVDARERIALWQRVDPVRADAVTLLYLANGAARVLKDCGVRLFVEMEALAANFMQAEGTCLSHLCTLHIAEGEAYYEGARSFVELDAVVFLPIGFGYRHYLLLQHFDSRYSRVDGGKLWPLFTALDATVSVEPASGRIFVYSEELRLHQEEGLTAAPRKTTSTIWDLWDAFSFQHHLLERLSRVMNSTAATS